MHKRVWNWRNRHRLRRGTWRRCAPSLELRSSHIVWRAVCRNCRDLRDWDVRIEFLDQKYSRRVGPRVGDAIAPILNRTPLQITEDRVKLNLKRITPEAEKQIPNFRIWAAERDEKTRFGSLSALSSAALPLPRRKGRGASIK